jgi:hypothetical protein
MAQEAERRRQNSCERACLSVDGETHLQCRRSISDNKRCNLDYSIISEIVQERGFYCTLGEEVLEMPRIDLGQ